jgi:hypothetical protein
VVTPEDYAQMMQPYKGFFISGQAKMIHPFSSESYPAGAVYKPGRLGSTVEVTRFELPSFTMEIGELAEWFGFELAVMVVDECLTPIR